MVVVNTASQKQRKSERSKHHRSSRRGLRSSESNMHREIERECVCDMGEGAGAE